MAAPSPPRRVADDLLATPSYSRAAGTRDLTPEATARRDRIEGRLLRCFSTYGFDRVDVPTLEYRDLYSPSRIGPDLFHHLVLARLPTSTTFPPDGLEGATGRDGAAPERSGGLTTHDAALRPDFTAPLARMLVTRLHAGDQMRKELPARWSYAGSVFRARSPRPLRLLEFRQAGVELLGAPHSMADLEVLALACDAARDLRIPSWRLHLGHAELFRALVDLAGPRDAHARTALANGLVLAARMRTRAELGDVGFARYLEGALQTLRQRVRDWLTVPGEVSESARVDDLLRSDWPELASPDALALDTWRTRLPALNERLLAETWTRSHLLPDVRAHALLQLAHSAGEPEAFFGAVGRYIEVMSGHATADQIARVDHLLDTFHTLTRDLRSVVDGPLPLLVTPAASRGIAYYTGVTFEIHTPATRTAYSDVCGGGRYSGLHRWLYDRAATTRAFQRQKAVAPPPPSRELADALTGVGFAFGVERLDAALQLEAAHRPRPDVYVAVQDAAFARDAFLTAQRLRRRGLTVVCELPKSRHTVRDLATQLGAAANVGGRGARHALIFGTEESRSGQVGLKDLDARTQRTLPLGEAEDHLLADRSVEASP